MAKVKSKKKAAANKHFIVKEDGTIEIRSDEGACAAIEAMKSLQAEIDQIEEENGLADLRRDAVAYKAAAQGYMLKKNLEQIQGDGWHGTIVRGFSDSRWIGTEDDLRGDEAHEATPLQAIIEKKFKSSVEEKGSKARKIWLKITRRIVDPGAIDELVAKGTLDADEISPAFVEKPRAPYLRLYDD